MKAKKQTCPCCVARQTNAKGQAKVANEENHQHFKLVRNGENLSVVPVENFIAPEVKE